MPRMRVGAVTGLRVRGGGEWARAVTFGTMRAYLIALVAMVAGACAWGQEWRAAPEVRAPEASREFRGVWVASVANIDWPSAKGLSQEAQLEEMGRILDMATRCNLNAIVLQVRPACDALYPSELEPWSEFLTGESGKPPQPLYDPLATWIKEAHARGLELHAWFNPFRARHFKSEKPDGAGHVSRTHPEWVRSYDTFLWLDPGVEAAREHSLRVIMDVVSRYDVDGVHLDDYFYPYPKGSLPFPDEQPYGAYVAAGGKLGRSDWRRSNIDGFMRELYQRVKKAKPEVKVGISPFGIWRPGYPPGIEGFDAYERLSADARLWLRSGWLDYCSPQLYWSVDSAKQSYARLQDWWIANNDRQRHLWIGNYTSRIEPADAPAGTATWLPEEIVKQVEATRASARGAGGATGNIHFSAVALVQNRRGIADALRSGPYRDPALVPASPWLAEGEAPGAPGVEVLKGEGEWMRVRVSAAKGTAAKRWVIWARYGETWRMVVAPAEGAEGAGVQEVPLRGTTGAGALNAVSVRGMDAFGREGQAGVVAVP